MQQHFWSFSSGVASSMGFIYFKHLCMLIAVCWILWFLKGFFKCLSVFLILKSQAIVWIMKSY